LLAITAGLIVLVAPALGADRLIKLAHPNRNDPFDNATGAMATVFKSLVESGSDGGIRVDVYPEGQVGADDAAIELVSKGVIQSTISSVGGIAPRYPLIQVLDIPFVFRFISDTYPVFDGSFGQRLADDIEQRTGLHVLGFGDSGGFFAITNSKRPIKSPADIAGLRIRTMNLDTHKIFVSSLGGEPVILAWSEVYGALQSGVVDGQMNPIPIIRFSRLDEVQKYLTLTNHFFAPYVWVMNRTFWDGLEPAERAVVDNAARSAIVAGRGLSRIIEASDRGLAVLKQRMDVYVPTKSELAAFQKVSQPAIRAYIEKTFGKNGSGLTDALLAAVGSP
jgi:tripartite ATP-independent transporter DctP family solute receptor